jgi:cyclopropane fatty-acyl-phospholipid synthase-like methyltransferase
MNSAQYHGVNGVGYDDYLADEPARSKEARRRYARDLGFIGERVLEVGCATGSLMAVLRENGRRVTGVDLCEVFAQKAGEWHGLEVAVRDVLSIEGEYDAILMFGTINNLRDLGSHLRKFHELLAVGGKLIFNFVDASSVFARLYGRRFWMFAPTVSTFMSARGCRDALETAGFVVETFRNDVQQPSLRKLMHHAKLPLKVPDVQLPPFPVPSTRFVVASKASS